MAPMAGTKVGKLKARVVRDLGDQASFRRRIKRFNSPVCAAARLRRQDIHNIIVTEGSLAKTAEILGISRERVRQLEREFHYDEVWRENTKLFEIVDQFRTKHPEWGVLDTALNQCFKASLAFAKYLRHAGIVAVVEELVIDDEHDSYLSDFYPNRMFQSHYVVKVREQFLVDWTVRQFEARAPFPLVIEIAD